MAVIAGSPVSASNTNAAFISRLVNSNTVGKLDLENVSTSSLFDLQRIINEALDAIGVNNKVATDPNTNTYTDQNNILNGDSYKTAIDKLDIALNVDAIKRSLLSFANDGDFVTAKGAAATGGDIYFNTTDDVVRVFDGTSWQTVGSSQAMEREIPSGTIDGVNDTFTTTYVPISEEHVSVYLDGLFVDDTEYSLSGQDITFNAPPEEGQTVFVWYFHTGATSPVSIPTGTQFTEYHTITAGEEIAESFSLAATPGNSSLVLVDIIGGGSQQYAVDFVIAGSTFTWSGFALSGVLEENDIVRLYYIA